MINFKNLVYELAILQEKVIDLDERIARFETGAAYEREEPTEGGNTKPLRKAERILWRVSGLIENMHGIESQEKLILSADIQRAIHEIQLIEASQ